MMLGRLLVYLPSRKRVMRKTEIGIGNGWPGRMLGSCGS